MASCPAYASLERLFARSSLIGQAIAILNWDTATMMPPGAAAGRAEQLATLKTLQHELLTGKEVKGRLGAAAGEDLDDWQRANLREMRRDWVHAAAVPAQLVEDLSRAASACEMIWRQARPAADFAAVAPALGDVLRLTREVAEVKSAGAGRVAL